MGVGQPAKWEAHSSEICFPLSVRFVAASFVEYLHFSSEAFGVGQPARAFADWVKLVPLMLGVIVPPRSPSVAEGVIQPARCAWRGS